MMTDEERFAEHFFQLNVLEIVRGFGWTFIVVKEGADYSSSYFERGDERICFELYVNMFTAWQDVVRSLFHPRTTVTARGDS